MTIGVAAHARPRQTPYCRAPMTRLERRRARPRARVPVPVPLRSALSPSTAKSLGIASHVVAPSWRTCGRRRTVPGHPEPWLVT
jgi:hypothetical protein